MTRRRWIADEVSGNRAALTGAHAQHLGRVLRARIGQKFDISTGSQIRQGEIVSVVPGRIEFELGEVIPVAGPVPVTLALSIFKFDRMEWAIEKCIELGVIRIIPVIAERTEKTLATAAGKRVERWRRIARQASEQSRQIAPPEISPPLKLKDLAGLTPGLRIVLSESERQMTLKDSLQSNSLTGAIALAIGPEGGWVQAELEWFNTSGWSSASLGNTVLRSETAAIAATSIAISELSE